MAKVTVSSKNTAARPAARPPAPQAKTPQAQKPAQVSKPQQATPPRQTAQQAQRPPARTAPAPQRPSPLNSPANRGPSVPAVARQAGASAIQEDMNTPLPAFMQDDIGRGTENIGREDLEIPRLKLMAATSKELQLYDQLRAGDFFHTATEEVFGNRTLVTPIYYEKRYLLWRPLDDGGGILARADDGVHWNPADSEFTVTLDKKDGGEQVTWVTADTVAKSGLANWGTMNPADKNSPPAATLMYNFVFAFPDAPDQIPAVFSFQRSSLKAGRRFNTKLKTVRVPMFGLVFELSSFLDHNQDNKEFFNARITGAGWISDEGLYNEYKLLHEGFTASGLVVKDEESIHEEAVADSTVDNSDGDDAGNKPGY